MSGRKTLLSLIARLSPGSQRLLLVPEAVRRTMASRRIWDELLRYKQSTGYGGSNAGFLFRFFLRRAEDGLFSLLLPEFPERYMQSVQIEGKEHVRQLATGSNGAILLAGHYGPRCMQSFLFHRVFGVPLGSYVSSEAEPSHYEELQRERIASSLPVYRTGEERTMLRAMLRGAWINILSDVWMYPPAGRQVTVFEKNMRFSVFPFRACLRYNLDLLFAGITRSGDSYILKITPIRHFANPEEGLDIYIKALEAVIRKDPLTVFKAPDWIRMTKG